MTPAAFVFDRYDFTPETGVLHLHYSFEGGADFIETIQFPPSQQPLSLPQRQALDHAVRLLFLLAGVSYYKAYAPPRLVCRAFDLDRDTASLLQTIYWYGLGEFAFENKIDLSDRIHFESTDSPAPTAVDLILPNGALVPVGGGKDSIVSLECLKQSGIPVTLFGLGGTSGLAAPIQATMERSTLPALRVARTLSPTLIELNKAGALNGHVPITAILSAIAVVTAILHGMDSVVLSNEHSASAPNTTFHGLDVNHQYSKSFAFEQDFAAYVQQHISPQIRYFSLLRPLTEAAIARRFSPYDQYFDIFRSCNTAFRQDVTRRNKNWCGDCPKCRFVFLALAPFIAPERLTTIFGKNMLDDPAQEQGYAELCGLTAFKPFECVGEIEESALLLQQLSRDPAWQKFALVQKLGQQLQQDDAAFGAAYQQLFTNRPDHAVPIEFLRMLDACA